MSCLGRCNKRPSHNILFNRSIVHAISLHVSEVPFSSMVSAHTIVCVYVLCTHYVCVPGPSADSAVCVQAQNRRCSKIKQTNILLICTPVYKFNIDELLLKLLAKRGSLTYFMYLPVKATRACQRRARDVHTEQNTARMYWKELSFAPKCFLIAYIFKQTRLKNACKWYNLVTTCKWLDLVSDKSERPSRHRTVFIVKPWYTFRK